MFSKKIYKFQDVFMYVVTKDGAGRLDYTLFYVWRYLELN